MKREFTFFIDTMNQRIHLDNNKYTKLDCAVEFLERQYVLQQLVAIQVVAFFSPCRLSSVMFILMVFV